MRSAKSLRRSSWLTVAEPARAKSSLHAHGREPLAVGADLGALGVEDAEGLLAVGRGVALDLLAAQHRPRGRAPRGVADAGGPVADDQHRQVPGVLELAQLAQHDRVAEVDVRRRRVDAELHAQRPAERELLREGVGRQAVDGAGGQARRRRSRGARKGLERYGEPARPNRQGRSVATEMPMRGPLTTSTGPARPLSVTRPSGRSASAPSRCAVDRERLA